MKEPPIEENFSVSTFESLDDWMDCFITPQQDEFNKYTSNLSNAPSNITNQSTSNTISTQNNFKSVLPTTAITTTITSHNSLLQIQTTINTNGGSVNDEKEEIPPSYNINLKTDLFNNRHFLLVGNLSKEHSYLKELIEANGGFVSKNYSSQSPIVLVNNNFNWNSSFTKSKKFQKVLVREVPVYYEKFLFDCIAAKCVLNLNDYLVPNNNSPQKNSSQKNSPQKNSPQKHPMNEEKQEDKPKKVQFICCGYLSNGIECDLEVTFEREQCEFCHYCSDDGERCYCNIDKSIENGKYCSLHKSIFD